VPVQFGANMFPVVPYGVQADMQLLGNFVTASASAN
jgi:hypothetical protein